MTAQEIRSKLRDGAVDPFDLVSEEGSNIQVELVEVDEIFSEGINTEEDVNNSTVMELGPHRTGIDKIKISEPEADAKESSSSDDRPSSSAPVKHSAPDSFESSESSSIGLSRGQGSYSYVKSAPKADAGSRSSQQSKKTKVKPKNYILVDQSKKELGPLSAEEIQSLYRRGILSDSVKVKSQSTGKKVSVRQFLAAYSGKRIKALSEKGNVGGKRYSSSKVLNELYHLVSASKSNRKRQLNSGFKIALVGILLGLGLFAFMDFRTSNKQQLKKRKIRNESVGRPDVRKKRRLKKARSPVTSQRKRVSREAPKQTVRKKTSKPVRSRSTSRPKVKKQTKSVARPRSRVEKKPERKVERKVIAKRSKPKRQTKAPAGPGVVELARANVGQLQTIGPLSFDREQLEQCITKCELRFVDDKGSVIVGIFFKGAFYDDLISKNNRVRLVGPTKEQNGQFQILIQDIR